MATINFLYRSTKENAPLTIRLLFREDNNDYVIGANSKYLIYTREELIENPNLSAKQYWQKTHNSKRIKDINLSNKQNDINNDLNKIENHILNEFEKIKSVDADKEWLQRVVDEFHNPNLNSELPIAIIPFIDYYLTVRRELKYRSQQKYITLRNKLKKHESEFSNGEILISDINDKFKERYYEVFSDYFINTLNKDLSFVKTLCRFAMNKGLAINNEVLRWTFKNKETTFVYLDEGEIEMIEKTEDLPEYLDNARDWLLISCYTGQRVSDFMRFNKSMVRIEKNRDGKDVHLVEFTQTKTNTIIAVPLHKKILEILDKRDGEFPRPLSSQNYNDYIKLVCQEAGINQKVKGGKLDPKILRKKFDKYEKWELISSHVGRRSFASNNFGKIPTRLLMSATGHKKEEMFLKYIGKTQTEQAKELANYF